MILFSSEDSHSQTTCAKGSNLRITKPVPLIDREKKSVTSSVCYLNKCIS